MSALEEIRSELFAEPEPKEIINHAIVEYNKVLEEIREKIYPYANREEVLRKGLAALVSRINTQEEKPTDRKFLPVIRNLVEAINQGKSVDQALQGIDTINRRTSKEELPHYFPSMCVQADRSNLVAVVNQLPSYQIVVLPAALEMPKPFSQNLIKKPDITKDEAERMYLDFLVDEELRKKYGPGTDVELALRRGGMYTIDVNRWFKNTEFIEIAKRVVSDLPAFEPIRPISESTVKKIASEIKGKTKSRQLKNYLETAGAFVFRDMFNELRLMPDMAFAAAFGKMEPEKEYFTVNFRGFDKAHQKVMLFQNNLSGMVMYIYAKLLGELEDQGKDVDIKDLTRVSKEYAQGVEGNLFSRSHTRDNYDVSVTHMALFRRFYKEAFGFWPDLTGNCHCKDLQYTAKLHKKLKYEFVYFCSHIVDLALKGYEIARNRGDNFIINPLPFPTKETIDFDRKLRWQTLVTRKLDGELKQTNRGEREWYTTLFARALGYEKAFTTDVQKAVRTAEQSYLGKISF